MLISDSTLRYRNAELTPGALVRSLLGRLAAVAVPASMRGDALPFGITFIAPAGPIARCANWARLSARSATKFRRLWASPRSNSRMGATEILISASQGVLR